MPHFNGPALAAEAVACLDATNWDDCAPDREARLFQSAQVYATLALTAAVLATQHDRLSTEDKAAWSRGLNPNRERRASQ